jgi:hypothetical protein
MFVIGVRSAVTKSHCIRRDRERDPITELTCGTVIGSGVDLVREPVTMLVHLARVNAMGL